MVHYQSHPTTPTVLSPLNATAFGQETRHLPSLLNQGESVGEEDEGEEEEETDHETEDDDEDTSEVVVPAKMKGKR